MLHCGIVIEGIRGWSRKEGMRWVFFNGNCEKNSFRNFIFLVGYLWLIKGNLHSHTLSKL